MWYRHCHLKRLQANIHRGHLEYEAETLHREYHRDLNKNLPIHAPEHYYDANGDILYSWKDAATCFYRNWLLLNQQ